MSELDNKIDNILTALQMNMISVATARERIKAVIHLDRLREMFKKKT